MKLCVVVPHYNHVDQFREFLPLLRSVDLPLIVVDDASPAPAFEALEKLLASGMPGTTLVRHSHNLGKGGAVMTGLRAAMSAGYSHALQIDADGQHDISSVPLLIDAAISHPDRLICGRPVFDDKISTLRFYARYITLSFSRLETLSLEIQDALCGFRLYPLKAIVTIIDRARLGQRMAFDPEVLVRAVWDDIRLVYVPVRVKYPDNGRSHFHYLKDNIEISWMHTRLLFGMLARLPKLARRRFEPAR
jgi:glycosyltransferase involved in cell wall biosynthesis